MLEAVKVWPGKGEACCEVGATTNLDSFCAHRRQRCAGRDEKPDFEIKSRNRRRKRCAALANSLTKKAPYKGLKPASLPQYEMLSDVRVGSKAGVATLNGDVHCVPKSRHRSPRARCPLSGNGRHSQSNPTIPKCSMSLLISVPKSCVNRLPSSGRLEVFTMSDGNERLNNVEDRSDNWRRSFFLRLKCDSAEVINGAGMLGRHQSEVCRGAAGRQSHQHVY